MAPERERNSVQGNAGTPVETTGTVDLRAAPGDRRTARRYPLQLSVEYKARSRNRGLWIGQGETRNISDKALLLTTNAALPVASAVELAIHWPVASGDCRLDLTITGTVLGSFARGTVVLVGKARFKRMPL
jgi:hypothetical protein